MQFHLLQLDTIYVSQTYYFFSLLKSPDQLDNYYNHDVLFLQQHMYMFLKYPHIFYAVDYCLLHNYTILSVIQNGEMLKKINENSAKLAKPIATQNLVKIVLGL